MIEKTLYRWSKSPPLDQVDFSVSGVGLDTRTLFQRKGDSLAVSPEIASQMTFSPQQPRHLLVTQTFLHPFFHAAMPIQGLSWPTQRPPS
jgi:hypothetical protein